MSRPFIIFSMIMFVKAYITWSVIFEEKVFWGVLLTDMPFIWLLFCLVEAFVSRRKMAAYIGINIGITLIFFATIMYFKYYGVIVTYHALNQLNQVAAVKDSVYTIIDPYYVLIFIDLLLIGIWSLRKRKFKHKQERRFAWGRKSVPLIFASLCLVIAMGNIYQNHASINEFVKAEEMGILGYEAYTVFMNDQLPEEVDIALTQQDINALKNIEPPLDRKLWEAAKGRHIIVIQLESLQTFLLNLRIDGEEVTPHLNELMQEHFTFPYFYQQVGSGNTSDAEFVVNTSFYIPPVGAATAVYGEKVLPSLPKIAKSRGYVAETFHTNTVEFWNRNALYAALGFDRYYDSDYFGLDDVVFFGASDEVLYEKAAARIAKLHDTEQRIYAHVISMTAHHPYTIPEHKQHFVLNEHLQDTLVGEYIVAQHYADKALGQFIAQLKFDGIWEDSLVVLYGDHLGLPNHLLESDDLELLHLLLGHEYSDLDMLNVPLIIAADGITYPAIFEQLGGHIDILPTIANLAGFSLEDHIHFGQDLLNHTDNLLPQRYYLPSGSFIKGHTLFLSGKWYEDGTAYTLDDHESTESITLHDFERALELLYLSDSYVSQLPEQPKQPK